MKIGFLSVGTEILLGDTVNTNLTNLGRRLYDAGFKLNKEITISILKPITPGLNKEEFLKTLENKIYSELNLLN